MNRTVLIIIAATVAVSALLVGGVYLFLFPQAPETRLIYRVDIEGALDDRMAVVAADLQQQLREREVAASVTREEGRLVLRLERADQAEQAMALIKREHSQNLAPRAAGGGRIELATRESYARQVRHDVFRQAVKVVRDRLEPLSVLSVVPTSDETIVVELPRLEEGELETIRRILKRRGLLEFRIVDDRSDLLQRIAATRKPGSGVSLKRDEYDGKQLGTVRYFTVTAKERTKLVRFLSGRPAALHPPVDREIHVGPSSGDDGELLYEAYYTHRRALVTGEDVRQAEVQWDERTGRPEVALTFTAAGGKRFARATERNVGRRLAIILDGNVNSAPVIQSKISGGRARITLGGFKDPMTLQQEARDLEAVLRAGALPARLELVRTERL